jgi:hypothetical protein
MMTLEITAGLGMAMAVIGASVLSLAFGMLLMLPRFYRWTVVQGRRCLYFFDMDEWMQIVCSAIAAVCFGVIVSILLMESYAQ